MATVICPNCKFVNPHGALYCQKCYGVLIDTVGMSKTETLNRRPSTPAVSTEQIREHRLAEAQAMAPYTVALYFESDPKPLLILLTKQAIIGRGTPVDEQMRVDLSAYHALEKGVSRQHAILKRVNATTVTIEDMGSNNGTWLNDALLQPYRAAIIISGSDLRLAKLNAGIYLP